MPISDEELQVLIEKISLDHSWDLSQYKWPTLKRRVFTRMNEAKCHSPEEYYELVSENEEEYTKLINALTVNYTYWFRDELAWNQILRIMDEKAHAKEGGTVRIWSAGCSTGEEPYSLAILAQKIKNLRETDEFKISFRIYATDIDQAALEKAKAGVYDNQNVNIDPDELEHYFDDLGDQYSIKQELKQMVHFDRLDLSKDEYPRYQDIILCRNVMIYFDKDLQKKVLQNFYYAMKEDGYLVNGKSEVLPISTKHLFEIIDLEEHIFQKI